MPPRVIYTSNQLYTSRFIQWCSDEAAPPRSLTRSGTTEELIMFQAASGEVRPRVTVVIPTLNEARNLPYVFSRLPEGLHEVIVVDGHSMDDTLAVVRRLRPDARIVMQNRCG